MKVTWSINLAAFICNPQSSVGFHLSRHLHGEMLVFISPRSSSWAPWLAYINPPSPRARLLAIPLSPRRSKLFRLAVVGTPSDHRSDSFRPYTSNSLEHTR
ncbi:hypothetical protein BDV11DRAFT_184919 [Aspergillus similis]